MAYNKSATPILETDATRPDGDSTNATKSIAFVMDVNGGRGPNEENLSKDIRGFRCAKFAKGYTCTGTEYDFGCTPVCHLDSGSYESIDCSSSASSTEDYKTYCGIPSGKSEDYWAGAKKACAEMGMQLPDKTTLKSIYDSYKSNTPAGVTLNGKFWSSSWFYYGYADALNFASGGTMDSNRNRDYYVLCVGD